jgi:hypothetical protein
MAFVSETTVVVGRLDGTLSSYDVVSGKLLVSVESSMKAANECAKDGKLANASAAPVSKGK